MNSEPKRPDPDELLARIKNEAKHKARGKLKVFLGYVAGVGKTYAMLEAAHQRKDEGVDVVIGYVETHGRKETESLVEDLEVLPRSQVNYRNASLSDMDLDAVLLRRPQLLLDCAIPSVIWMWKKYWMPVLMFTRPSTSSIWKA
jgi:two-component system sensor histidine kinase KdpD